MRKIILIGGGGHCKSIIDSIISLNEYEIVGILDLPDKVGSKICGIEVIGSDDRTEYYYNQGIDYAFISLGSIGDISLRKKLYKSVKNIGYKIPNIIDSTAILAKNIWIGEGNYIGKSAIINSDTKIGNNTIINTGVIIEHDCSICDFVHVGPGSTLSGNVKIEKNTHIGTNSTIIQNVNIGSDTIIGAGSVVVRDIKNNVKAYGNPCKEV